MPEPAVRPLPARRTLADVAVGAIGWHALRGEAAGPELAYLEGRARLLGGDDPARWEAAAEQALAAPAPDDARLVALAPRLGLCTLELLTAALALACERELMVGQALAFMQRPVGGSRPMLALVRAALGFAASPGTDPLDELLTGAALSSGLLVLAAGAGPLPERSVAVPEPLALALRGFPPCRPGARLATPADELALPESLLQACRRHARGLDDGVGRTLVLRTGSPREGRAVAEAVAAALDRRALFLTGEDMTGVVPWLLCDGLLPVFERELAPSERWRPPALPHYDGPTMVITGPDGAVEGGTGGALSFRIPVPPVEERAALWSAALGDADAGAGADVARTLAASHRQGSGRIASLGGLARQRAAMDGRALATPADVLEAARAGEASGLDALAEHIGATVGDDGLVLPERAREELALLHLRCRQRETLARALGAAASNRYHPGVRALFVGPSGTGKTLAACWLASRLALPLYRVDLAAVVSKYIGETEKNLAQLLARAEDAEVVLLFDEADALFGKRTEVKQANDRFANAQTNYLLQRIESFDGIVVLTSNSRSRFDPAFTRRLDFILEFPAPAPQERRALWLAHLGEGHALAASDINELAATADFAGGHVRNVVLCAAVLAEAERRPIAWRDVLRGLEVEYRKLGLQMPAALMRDRRDGESALRASLRARGHQRITSRD
jgi:hypothetical protein